MGGNRFVIALVAAVAVALCVALAGFLPGWWPIVSGVIVAGMIVYFWPSNLYLKMASMTLGAYLPILFAGALSKYNLVVIAGTDERQYKLLAAAEAITFDAGPWPHLVANGLIVLFVVADLVTRNAINVNLMFGSLERLTKAQFTDVLLCVVGGSFATLYMLITENDAVDFLSPLFSLSLFMYCAYKSFNPRG